MLNAIFEDSLEEPSSYDYESVDEEPIPCSGCINVLTNTQKDLLDIVEDDAIRKKMLLRLQEDLETLDQKFKDPMKFRFKLL